MNGHRPSPDPWDGPRSNAGRVNRADVNDVGPMMTRYNTLTVVASAVPSTSR